MTGGQYGLGRDLVTGVAFTGTNSPTIGLAPDGPAADFSSTAYAEAPHDASWNVLGHVTVLWRGIVRTPTVGGYLVGKIPSAGNGATNTPYSLEYNNGSAASVSWIRSNATGGDPYKLWNSNASTVVANTPQTFAVSTDDTITTTPAIYIDGVSVTANFIYGFGGGAPTGNSDPLRLGRRQDGANQHDGLTSIVLIAAAQWDAGQHQLAHLSPYGVLEEAPRYYFGATSGSAHTATPGAGSETYAGKGATVTAGAALLPGAGAEAYAGKQAAVTAGATVAVGAGTEAYQGLAASVTQPATVEVGAGLVEVLGLQASLGSALHGTLRRRGRYRAYRDVPVELAPAVDLAAGYVEAEVERTVEDAMRRLRALSLKASVARRTALVQELNTQIVAAVARAAEADEEDAIAALL